VKLCTQICDPGLMGLDWGCGGVWDGGGVGVRCNMGFAAAGGRLYVLGGQDSAGDAVG
jgi:hypothetical protein